MATLIAVSNYTDTSILAHTPKGAENDAGVSLYWLDPTTGTLKPAGALEVGPNPAFLLQHPDDPTTLYASTERIDDDGEVRFMSDEERATQLATAYEVRDANCVDQ